MLLTPRLGKRRWSGICPPSKPLMATPVRAFCPLTPRPAVLPLPDPGPRPTRIRLLVDPGRGASSLSLVIDASPWSYAPGEAHLGWFKLVLLPPTSGGTDGEP